MLIVKDDGQLQGCIDNGTNYCIRCTWNQPNIVEMFGECPKRVQYSLMGFFLNSYLRTCKKCGDVYGCRIVGTNFSVERLCDGCPEYFDCLMVDKCDPKVDGQCLHCANKEDYED